LGESDHFINRKVLCGLAAGLKVILCVGETLEQRNAKQTETVLHRQLSTGLASVSAKDLADLSIAYEPVWAIGNEEHHATPRQAHDAHVLIRQKLSLIFGESVSQEMSVQYDGSVDPENAALFLAQPGIDGVLIGGASLKAEEFLAILHAGIMGTRAEMQPA
jgi:triosephosphate isomerase